MSGGDKVEVFGAEFGPQDSVLYALVFVSIDGVPCSNTTWVADTMLVCTTPPGVGANLPLRVHAGGDSSLASERFSYGAPFVSK